MVGCLVPHCIAEKIRPVGRSSGACHSNGAWAQVVCLPCGEHDIEDDSRTVGGTNSSYAFVGIPGFEGMEHSDLC